MIYHLNTAHPTLVKESGGSSSLQQASLDSVLARTRRSCNAQRAEKVTELIAKMVETDMLPVSAVEGKGFHELIKFLEPEYTMASRRTVTRRIETHYEQRAQELLKELTMADKVAITTDCWKTSLKKNTGIFHYYFHKSTGIVIIFKTNKKTLTINRLLLINSPGDRGRKLHRMPIPNEDTNLPDLFPDPGDYE